MISTASMGAALVFAQRVIWFRLLPMRAICRVRSRSTSAAAAVQVRVRAMACRSRSESGTPAAWALARHCGELGWRHPQVELPGAAVSHQRTARGLGGIPPTSARKGRVRPGVQGGVASPWPAPCVHKG